MENTILKTTAQIEGVVFKELKTHSDNRGFFREIVRKTDDFFGDGFAQWSHSKMAYNTVKAWHFHHLQIDWWYVPFGLIKTVLYDDRKESPTYGLKLDFLMGDAESHKEALSTVVKIPQGVIHGCQVLSDFAHLFYITSNTYDPEDEGRFPFNSELVPHTWQGDEKNFIVSDNDRRTHLPSYKRV